MNKLPDPPKVYRVARWFWLERFIAKHFPKTFLRKMWKLQKKRGNKYFIKSDMIVRSDSITIDYTVYVNLTECFGKGNEPKIKDMDKFMKRHNDEIVNMVSNGGFNNEIIEKDGKKYEKVITGWDTFELREVKDEI